MTELRKTLQETMNQELIQIILSNTRDASRASRVKMRPVLLKGQLLFQETLYCGTQVFHGNYDQEEMVSRTERYLEELFKQGEIKCQGQQVTILVSKKGKLTIKRKALREDGGKKAEGSTEGKAPSENGLQHNRTKCYLLPEGKPVDFLVELGVQTREGKIVRSKYDKFRQINRYLEIVEDVLGALPEGKLLQIIDFGCGKSYLTFALYYYLHELQQRDIRVTGLDLKRDVITHCNQLAEKLGYEHLHFEHGDISTYEGAEAPDMVVSLHACDTATDYALEKAVKWGARVILAVPCCQHELNRQIRCDVLQPILKYGLIKERIAALVTDALRANLLEAQGYEVQILEFIDMEHTPKNILIRAVKSSRIRPRGERGREKSTQVTDFLQISPTLDRLLKE